MTRIANAASTRGRRSERVERAAIGPDSIDGGPHDQSWMRAPVLTSALAVALAVAGLACAPAAPQRFPAKPPGCALEMINTLPQRPYIELETVGLPSPESMGDVRHMVEERACRDGADAVYAPKAGRVYSYAIALKWNDPPPAPTPVP